MAHLIPTYARLPLSFSHGKGVYLWDDTGKKYLDAISGIGVCALGHADADLYQALCSQAQKLWHTSNIYNIQPQQQLAKKLCQVAAMEQAFFCNSGTEANEAAIKIARKYASLRGIEQAQIIVFEGAFHGRSTGALAATANRNIKQGFGELLPGFIRLPFNDIEQVAKHSNNKNIAAVLLEPIQGEGGVTIAKRDFMRQLQQLCHKNKWLFMLDEVQTGLGRTGAWFAHQHSDVKPDVLSLAKALGNGMPIGAVLVNDKALNVLDAGSHGSTFGGNFLACKVALEVLTQFEKRQIIANVQQIGAHLNQCLNNELKGIPELVAIEQQGLMVGIKMNRDCGSLVLKAAEQHQLLINVTASSVIRLLPPLILNQQQATSIATKIGTLLRDNF